MQLDLAVPLREEGFPGMPCLADIPFLRNFLPAHRLGKGREVTVYGRDCIDRSYGQTTARGKSGTCVIPGGRRRGRDCASVRRSPVPHRPGP
jgi:hypothetical protein